MLTILTGFLFAGGAALYTDHREDVMEQSVRRSRLLDLLVEYRQRLSALEMLDSKLNPFIGEAPGISTPDGKPATDADRKAFEKLSSEIGRLQSEVIKGGGTYVPSAPAFANVNLQTVTSQIEDAAGIPNLQGGAMQMLGLLDWESEVLWLTVHGLLPELQKFYIGRHMLATNGQLPLFRGATLNINQENVLGIPQPKPGELELLMKENEIAHEALQAKLVGENK